MNDIVKAVFQKGVLFDITIGSWAAIHLMKPVDLNMPDINKKAMHLGHKYLLSRDSLSEVVYLSGKTRNYVAQRSAPFPIAGAVFIPYKGLKETLKGLGKLKDQYMGAAQDLVKKYPQYKNEQLQVLDSEAERIAESLLIGYIPMTDPWKRRRAELDQWLSDQYAQHRTFYPDAEELLSKFYMSWRLFKIDPVQGSGEISDLDADELQAHQDKLKADMEEWVKDQTTKMHVVLGQAAKDAMELVQKQGKLNPKNLKKIFAAFEKFKAIDFAGSDWSSYIDNLFAEYVVKNQDGTDNYEAMADKINSGEEFGKLLESIGTLAVEEAAIAAADNALAKDFKRVIEL